MALQRILEPEVMDTREEAVDYDNMDHSEVNRVFVNDLLAFAKRVRPEGIRREDDPDQEGYSLGDVLDPGTGTALIPVELCKQDSGCRVMAIDMAENMLQLARYNAAEFPDRIQLDKVDAKQSGLNTGMFDTVMSNSIIHHIHDPLVCLKEMVRVTADSGILFFRDLMRPDDEATLESLVQQYVGSENEHSQQLFRQSLWAALDLKEIQSLVVELGFDAQTVAATTDRHWTWAARKD